MPLTEVIPKPMIPFMGSTLIADGISKIKPHIDNIHITVGYKGAVLAQHVTEQGVTSVFNTSGKGNAWWLYNTLMMYLDEPLFVLTCDNVVELEFDRLAEEYYDFDRPACMVVPVRPVAGLNGDYIFQEQNVVTKFHRQQQSDRYCSGIQILNPHRVNELTNETEDFYSVWDQLIQQKQVYCSEIYPKQWFTVNTLEELDQLKSVMAAAQGVDLEQQ